MSFPLSLSIYLSPFIDLSSLISFFFGSVLLLSISLLSRFESTLPAHAHLTFHTDDTNINIYFLSLPPSLCVFFLSFLVQFLTESYQTHLSSSSSLLPVKDTVLFVAFPPCFIFGHTRPSRRRLQSVIPVLASFSFF